MTITSNARPRTLESVSSNTLGRGGDCLGLRKPKRTRPQCDDKVQPNPTPGGGKTDSPKSPPPASPNVDSTPTDKPRGYSKRPYKYRFDVDNQHKRGIGETHEYTSYIAKHHAMQEKENPRKPGAFERTQVDVKPRMRTILFTWLVDVHRKFGLVDEVLWRTFEILDRYLATKKESRRNLQLLACAALWVASKYHEIYPPTAEDLVTVSDKAFTKTALIKMELQLCRHFGMMFTYPSTCDFLRRYTEIALATLQVAPEKEAKLKKRIKYLAMYGAERITMETHSLKYKSSLLAACSLFTAMTLLSYQWTTELEQATGLNSTHFREQYDLYRRIKAHVMDFTSKHHSAVIRKYATEERGEVSSLRKKANQPPKRTSSQRSPETHSVQGNGLQKRVKR